MKLAIQTIMLSVIVSLTACQSNEDKLAGLKVSKAAQYRYCSSNVTRSYNSEYTNEILECIQETSEQNALNWAYVEDREARLFREAFAQEQIYKEAERKRQNANVAAKEEIELIEAKIRVYPTEERNNSRKLSYCRTKPEWRVHGVAIARELSRNKSFTVNPLKREQNTSHLEWKILLECFKNARDEKVESFFLSDLEKRISDDKALDEVFRESGLIQPE